MKSKHTLKTPPPKKKRGNKGKKEKKKPKKKKRTVTVLFRKRHTSSKVWEGPFPPKKDICKRLLSQSLNQKSKGSSCGIFWKKNESFLRAVGTLTPY